MSEVNRFLQLAGLELIRQEAVRVVKPPPSADGPAGWTPGWDDWDEVLAGEGAGVQPSIYALRSASGMDPGSCREVYDALVSRVSGSPIVRGSSGINVGLRLVAVFCFDSLDAGMARRLARFVPERYYANLKPEVWVADLSQGKLWAPKTLGLFASRPQTAVKRALETTLHGAAQVDSFDLSRAQTWAVKERAAFVSTLRHNVPYVTYALLAACWIVFFFESLYPSGSSSARTLLHFGAMQPKLVERGEWWLLLTAMFVHVGVVHILFNSVALYSVGSLVERIYGAIRYTLIYFVSGILASVASYAFLALTGQSDNIAAGASGAIFGIAGVVIVLGVLRHSVVPRSVALQLSIFMGILIVMNIGFDAVNPQIDIRAHIGGLLVGLVMGYFLAPRIHSPAGAESGGLVS